MPTDKDKLVRLNVRVSGESNDFLERKSARTGISKSALVQIAVEQYRQQEEAIQIMGSLQGIMGQLEELKTELDKVKDKEVQ